MNPSLQYSPRPLVPELLASIVCGGTMSQGSGVATGRISGLDPRLFLSFGVMLEVDGMSKPLSTEGDGTLLGIDCLTASAYPLIQTGESASPGEPIPPLDAQDVSPIFRADGQVIRVFGCGLVPATNEITLTVQYDLSKVNEETAFTRWTTVRAYLWAVAGLNPATSPQDCAGILGRVRIEVGDYLSRALVLE